MHYWLFTFMFNEYYKLLTTKHFVLQSFSIALSVDFDDISSQEESNDDSRDIQVKDIEVVQSGEELGVKKLVVEYDYSNTYPTDAALRAKVIQVVDTVVQEALFPLK